MSLRINCIICTTAMNYLYASLDKNLGQHDVICSNKDIAFWIKKNYSRGLRDVHILNFHPKYNYLKNHFFDSSENLLWKKLKSNKYQNYYLSFCSGWHFNWMQKKLNLKFSQIILLDDGIGNTLLVPTKFFILKKIISFLISLKINSFSRYRDFNNPNIENIITIYGKFNNFSFHKPKNIINISENFRSKIIDNIQTNNLLFKNKYGIYIASLQGVYSKDKTVLKKIKKRINFLEKKTNVKWFIKVKPEDPNINDYKRNGIPVIFTTINQELILDKNIKYICSGYDTFTLNSILLGFNIKLFIYNDRSKQMHDKKINVINKVIKMNSFTNFEKIN